MSTLSEIVPSAVVESGNNCVLQIKIFMTSRWRDAAALNGHQAMDFISESIQSLCFTDNFNKTLSWKKINLLLCCTSKHT